MIAPDVAPCGHERITPGCRLCSIAAADPRYARLFFGDDAARAPAPPAPGGGPGTELTTLLESLGLGKLPGCKCAARARKMDAWGVSGCREHRGEILGWLREGYDASGWLSRLKAGAAALAAGVPLTADPLGWVVGEAIRRAEEKALASWPKRFDEHDLWPGTPGKRFNPSLIAHEGGYLLAARNGWTGSEIYLGRLDADFRPVGGPWRLDLYHPREANYGREDPRLFSHGGRVHVAYVGVVGGHSILHTSMLYARLTADCTVEEVFYLDVPHRQKWEKNISLFSHDGELYGVYYTLPTHRVLRVRGGRAEFAHATPTPPVWAGGQVRGGASPVRVGDEYFHFFHDRVEQGGLRVYRTGLLAFEAAPPFRVTRMVREPLFVANDADRPRDQYCPVVFPGGAVRVGDDWVLAQGRHDRWCSLDRVSHEELERKLVSV